MIHLRRHSACFTLLLMLAACSSDERRGVGDVNPDTSLPSYVAIARGQVDVDGGVIHLAAPRDGRIVTVAVAEGDSVKANDVLVTIDQRQAEINADIARADRDQALAQVRVLQAKLPAAQHQAARTLEASSVGAASEQSADETGALLAAQQAEIEVAKAAVQVAEQRWKAARYEVEVRVIRAPVDGLVARSLVHQGDSVTAQTPSELFLLIPNRRLIVRAELEEGFAGKVHPGMAAEVMPEDEGNLMYLANVERVGELFGRGTPAYQSNEHVDTRVLDCVLSLQDAKLRVGQRVLVKIKPKIAAQEVHN